MRGVPIILDTVCLIIYPIILHRLLQATQAAGDVGLYHYWLGRVYWEMGGETRRDKAKCLGSLLKVNFKQTWRIRNGKEDV